MINKTKIIINICKIGLIIVVISMIYVIYKENNIKQTNNLINKDAYHIYHKYDKVYIEANNFCFYYFGVANKNKNYYNINIGYADLHNFTSTFMLKIKVKNNEIIKIKNRKFLFKNIKDNSCIIKRIK
jgi:hypothetical protein